MNSDFCCRIYYSGEGDRVRRPDGDNQEWTTEAFADARPAKADRKVNQTLRLDADVLEAYRGEGSGWQTRMNAVLRAHMPKVEK